MTYYLKNKDKLLAKFDIEESILGQSVKLLSFDTDVNQLPETVHDEYSLEEWLKNRFLPSNRAFVKEFYINQGLNPNDLKNLLDISKSLSLNDAYWVTNDDNQKFENYNLYQNGFDSSIGDLVFTGFGGHHVANFTSSPEYTTGGTLVKRWIRENDKTYLLKGGTGAKLDDNIALEPFSEIFSYKIAEHLGIKSVKYTTEFYKGVFVSKCENFTSLDKRYVPALYFLKQYTPQGIDAFLKQNPILKEDFANMLVLDSLILNYDRHYGNWGVLKDNTSNQIIGMAPVFDCGCSLMSDVKDISSDKNKLDEYRQALKFSKIGNSYDRLLSYFGGPSQAKMLRKATTLPFVKMVAEYNKTQDKKAPFPIERAKKIEYIIQTQAKEMLSVLSKHDIDIEKVSENVKEYDAKTLFGDEIEQFLKENKMLDDVNGALNIGLGKRDLVISVEPMITRQLVLKNNIKLAKIWRELLGYKYFCNHDNIDKFIDSKKYCVDRSVSGEDSSSGHKNECGIKKNFTR